MSRMIIQQLRVARPTNQLAEIVRFYQHLLDFDIIARFADHAGFDGVMLGHPAAAFHLEFTCERGNRAAAVARSPKICSSSISMTIRGPRSWGG